MMTMKVKFILSKSCYSRSVSTCASHSYTYRLQVTKWCWQEQRNKALQHNLQKPNEKLEESGMKANWQKTNVIRIGRKQQVCIMLKLMVREQSK